jgi:hypothetical protein
VGDNSLGICNLSQFRGDLFLFSGYSLLLHSHGLSGSLLLGLFSGNLGISDGFLLGSLLSSKFGSLFSSGLVLGVELSLRLGVLLFSHEDNSLLFGIDISLQFGESLFLRSLESSSLGLLSSLFDGDLLGKFLGSKSSSVRGISSSLSLVLVLLLVKSHFLESDLLSDLSFMGLSFFSSHFSNLGITVFLLLLGSNFLLFFLNFLLGLSCLFDSFSLSL